MAPVFNVDVKGIGKPDYSREVSSARERAGLTLAFGQTLRIFGIVFSAVASPFAWVTGLLAPAASRSFIDNMTGLSLPFTIPLGFTLTLIAGGGSVSEDSQTLAFLDGFLVMSSSLVQGGAHVYENKIIGLSTATIDPTGLAVHTLDVQVINLGLGDLSGGIEWTGILEEVGVG